MQDYRRALNEIHSDYAALSITPDTLQRLEVGRYISLERLIEESQESYYECLRLSSQRWHDGKQELTPWSNFLFAIIRRAYVELEERAGQIKAHGVPSPSGYSPPFAPNWANPVIQ